MRIVFLHLPKTAGQSVHAALESCFPAETICPARVNDQLTRLTIAELCQYRIFSGHLDWSLLDAVPGPKYVFTVLRDPLERVLSFYFYLRKQASILSRDQLDRIENRGLKAALEFTAREFFVGGDRELREFLDTHFDNFCAYYFAGRYFEARRMLRGAIDTGSMASADIVRMALSNLRQLSDVFTLGDMPRLFATIETLSGRSLPSSFATVHNRNDEIAGDSRLTAFRDLGGDDETIARIGECVELDRKIWDVYAPLPAAYA